MGKRFELGLVIRNFGRLLPTGIAGSKARYYRGTGGSTPEEWKLMPGTLLSVSIRAGEKCISIPAAQVIIGSKGLFARDVFFPTGTSVVVQLFDGHHQLKLFGIVRTTDSDSGLAIEFNETTESMTRRPEHGEG